ncbi:DNA (cytosine-5)-methyltransferase 1 [Termitomyces sp. J132]|nr:DNA (cytosine-5)-methyltransferase 1 [Termitomyces sp. J132]
MSPHHTRRLLFNRKRQVHIRLEGLHPSNGKATCSTILVSRSGVNCLLVTSFYRHRGGELESPDLVIIGEDPFADEDDDPNAKPVRVLSDFAIYDPKHRNEMVLLSSIEEDDGVDRQFEAEGIVSPYYQNDEDEGQEDDDDIEDNSELKMVKLGAILRYTFDYTETDGKVYIETQFAWYILDAPVAEYEPLFQHFFKPRRISQMIITSALKSPRITYEEFLGRLIMKVDIFGATYQEKHLLDALSIIQDAVNECEEYEKLKDLPLIRHVLRKSSSSQPRLRRKNAPNTRGKPPPIKALMGNLDIALLDRENAVSTHVTPLIASLAQGLVSEDLVVVGVRPPPDNKTSKEKQKLAAHQRLCELILKAKGERKMVERIGQDSRYPTAVVINGETFRNGDFVVIPRSHDNYKGYYKPSDLLPDNIEDVDPTSTIADYFWFAQIVHCDMDPSPGHFHVQWLQHSTQTMLEELGHPQELFWNDICENVPLGAVIDKVKVHEISEPPENSDEYFVKFVYDINQATYTSIVPERRELVAFSLPPFNCTICRLLDQRDQEKSENKLRDEKGNTNGVAFRGEKYHFEDFVLYHAQQGPAHLGYIVDFRIINNRKLRSEVYLRRLGRISSLGNVLPDNVLKDERHVFLTDEKVTVPLQDLICVCNVFTKESFNSDSHLKSWLASFPSVNVKSWDQHKQVRPSDLEVCTPCTRSALEELKTLKRFLEDAECRPLKTLDIFGGVGAFSMGLGEGSGCLEVTDVVELAPSAVKTVMRNFPNVAVHNRCANEVLRYSIKEKLGQKPKPLRQHYDERIILPSLKTPDLIVAGVPCQTHSRLNRFKRAGDKKSNLILTALSFVDHLRPKLFYFENVPGFKEFTFDAVQSAPYTVKGGIPMGGLKFVIRALIDMGYQVRFGMLQAGHYGTPQRRHRFFLIAAVDGHPLPELPQPSHDFPDNYGLGIKLESSEEWIRPIRVANGTAPHPFVTIDDAISDLPRFDWKPPRSSLNGRSGIPQMICDPASKHCGYSGNVRYHHEVKTSYQEAARSKGTKNLQHFTRTFKPEKVKRVIAIPLSAGADYRSLPPDLLEWQISNPLSSVAKSNFRPGIYGRLDQNLFFPTTVTNMDTTAKQSHVLNPYCHRMVTVRELARSQGFPDHFVFEASDDGVVTMHRQIGNAVPIPVGVALGRELRKARFKEWLANRQNAIVVNIEE